MSNFTDKLKHVHNRLSQRAEVDIKYAVKSTGTVLDIKAVPVFYPAELVNLSPVRTERQVFFIKCSDLSINGKQIHPALNDRVIYKGDIFKVVAPVSEINPKSNDASYDFTTSDRSVLKIETIRERRA